MIADNVHPAELAQATGPAAMHPDAALIAQAQRHAATGTRHLAIAARPSALWLEVYRLFPAWLEADHRCLLHPGRATVDQLTSVPW